MTMIPSLSPGNFLQATHLTTHSPTLQETTARASTVPAVTFAMAVFMNTIGGCAASRPNLCNSSSSYASAMDEICGLSNGESVSQQETRIRNEIASVGQDILRLEEEIDRAADRSLRTYNMAVETTRADSPDFSRARAAIEDMRGLNVVVASGLNRHRDLTALTNRHWECLQSLYRKTGRDWAGPFLESLTSRRPCYQNAQVDRMLQRLFHRATERFNALPGHGADIPSNQPCGGPDVI